jgi:hypothetical protein
VLSVVVLLRRADELESSRLPRSSDGLAIADYRIICVFHGANGQIQAIGYSEAGHGVMYDEVWTIEQARQEIEKGHRLYIVSASTGAEAELEAHGDGIRTKPEQSTDNTLDDLPIRD